MTNTNIKARVFEWFQHFHQHPEISWREVETTSYIRDILKTYGCEITSFPDYTGVIGELGSGSPVVALRADLDALWQNVAGTMTANHSCGHDAHMAMVLGVVAALSSEADHLKGTVRFIFQPAEEKGQGALAMSAEGITEDVDYLYGVHLRPVQEVADGDATPAIVHGAARLISGHINGEDAHGARPHLGTNATEIGTAINEGLRRIHIDPLIPHSIKMTAFHAGGESANIIPGQASFKIDMRAQTNGGMTQLADHLDRLVQKTAESYGVEIPLQTDANIAGAEVNAEAEDVMRTAIQEVLGAQHLCAPLITPGGDDFHFYTLERPRLKATMLGLGCDLTPGLHHPDMTFNQERLMTGTEILTAAVKETLAKVKG